MMNTKITIFLACLVIATTQAFSLSTTKCNKFHSSPVVERPQIPLRLNDHFSKSRGDKTKMLLSPLDEDEMESVNVNLVDEVDSFTLTAIGFALIAFNFFVFANMGDGGIGGIVARLINYFT